MYGVGWGGAGQIDFTFGLRAGRWERGAMLQPKIYNTGKYDNSLYKGTSN